MKGTVKMQSRRCNHLIISNEWYSRISEQAIGRFVSFGGGAAVSISQCAHPQFHRVCDPRDDAAGASSQRRQPGPGLSRFPRALSLIHISEPTRLLSISY